MVLAISSLAWACCLDAWEMDWISSPSWVDTVSISWSLFRAPSASREPSTTRWMLSSMELPASLISAWMFLINVSICFVALVERSASRCTSSATTAKPRPASPAMAAWMEALSARIEVRSAMSLMS